MTKTVNCPTCQEEIEAELVDVGIPGYRVRHAVHCGWGHEFGGEEASILWRRDSP